MAEQKKLKKSPVPLGVMVLGGLNCLFGLSTLASYFKITPESFARFSELLRDRNLSQQITFQQFKASGRIFLLISLAFLVSGAGVILKKEWARKILLYFSFAAIAMMFLASLAQPGAIGFFIVYIAYFGITIFYFTNKKVESYFTAPAGTPPEERGR